MQRQAKIILCIGFLFCFIGIAYAIEHLHTPLVLILGHESCGAVTAALMPDSLKQQEPEFLQKLLKHIEPAVANIDLSLSQEEQIKQGVEANVLFSVKHLQDRLSKLKVYENTLIAGAVYNLESGEVTVVK